MNDDDLRAEPVQAHDVRLADGRPMAPLLGDESGPLEGPGVPFLLNPVHALDMRLWATWQVGSCALWRPRLPCEDFFEFEALHRVRYAAMVEKAGAQQDEIIDEHGQPRTQALSRFLMAAGGSAGAALQDLGALWARRARYAQVLAKRDGPAPRDVADAVAIMREVEPVPLGPEQLVPLLVDLVALSRKQHGPAAGGVGSPVPEG
ncbi:MAG: hypothetical protein K0V04_16395 [Deltaproteobacteria bacterium]|nr:hypothetical protein [Deltaproteobacteria bacterium]